MEGLCGLSRHVGMPSPSLSGIPPNCTNVQRGYDVEGHTGSWKVAEPPVELGLPCTRSGKCDSARCCCHPRAEEPTAFVGAGGLSRSSGAGSATGGPARQAFVQETARALPSKTTTRSGSAFIPTHDARQREAKTECLWRSRAAAGAAEMASPTNSKVNGNGDGGDSLGSRIASKISLRTLAVAAFFGGAGLAIKLLLSTLPPDFESRWKSLFNDMPEPELPELGKAADRPTVFFDRHGVVIATITSGGYTYDRKPRGLTEKSGSSPTAGIPSWMWQAVVASEDRSFFTHAGIDPRGLSRAVLSLAASGGGSTITQQLVKNVFLTNERKWTRKLLELILALALEKRASKWDILNLYMKEIYWGHGVYGIHGASALYFGKHPSLLELGECAMLAGIIPAPELLSPYRDPSRGRKPQARTLRRMVEAGFLDAATALNAMKEPLRLAIESTEGTSGPWKAPYFVSEVLYELTQMYGWSEVVRGGLQVHTTLDLSMQTVAERIVRDAGIDYDDERIVLSERGLQKTKDRLEEIQQERLNKMTKVVQSVLEREKRAAPKKLRNGNTMENEGASQKPRTEIQDIGASSAARKAAASVIQRYFTAEEYLHATVLKYQEEIRDAKKSRLEAAMVAIDPMSGAVRVLVGGRDYYESNFNRGTQAYRSPGSTFKPVVYLTALAEGFKWDHALLDEPFTVGDFTPENYDQRFRGPVTLEQSLVYSINVPTVRLCADVGVDKVCEVGRALGIDTYLPPELALSLGGCEVTPMQLASVYATIAAGGLYRKPHLVTRVETSTGHVLMEHKVIMVTPARRDQLSPVVSKSAVADLRKLLQAVVDRGTGRGAQLGRPCAGKTGTSNEHRDVWFAGFTPEMSCVVWLGYDDNRPVGGLHSATGASHAAPIWKEFMKTVHEDIPVRAFHDIGTDQFGGMAPPRRFVKRTRRPARIGLTKIRKQRQKREAVPWKQIWDWEKASIAWEEQEKMKDWISMRAKRAEEMPNWAHDMRPFFTERPSDLQR